MKYFVVSDIHGHFKELIKALKDANYDENNKNEKLIVAGDMFDRGCESREVYEYLFRLSNENKAIIIRGNHEVFLEELFAGNFDRVRFNIKHNGFGKTLRSFVQLFDSLSLEKVKEYINEHYPKLNSFITNLPYYFETEKYIITHAGLDFSNDDFRIGNWKRAVWTLPEEFFQIDLQNKYNFNKKVIVGHRFTNRLRSFFGQYNSRDYSIYHHNDGQKIGIDGGVYISKQINVFTFEE